MPALMNEGRIRIGEMNLMDESCGTEFPQDEATPAASQIKLTKLPE
jgi:hypothetical protein